MRPGRTGGGRAQSAATSISCRRPRAFAGGYEPLEGGSDTCAFTRSGEVLVAVAVRGELRAPRPAGTWRDVVRTPTLLLAERI